VGRSNREGNVDGSVEDGKRVGLPLGTSVEEGSLVRTVGEDEIIDVGTRVGLIVGISVGDDAVGTWVGL
jgi:hypothetical protein